MALPVSLFLKLQVSFDMCIPVDIEENNTDTNPEKVRDADAHTSA